MIRDSQAGRTVHRLVLRAFAAAVLLAIQISAAPALPAATLGAELDAIVDSPHLNGSAFGLTVYSVNQDRFLREVNGNNPLVPASNQKLLVTAAALFELGPDFEFTTELYTTGPVEDGVLYGDIVIRGGGDPNLSGRFNGGDACHDVGAWVRAIQGAGITKMAGGIVIDDSLFDAQFFHPSWPPNQKHRWYAAPVGALSLNNNCVDMTINPTTPGERASFTFEPGTEYVTVQNECKTVPGRSTDNVIISRNGREIYLGGRIGVRSRGYTAGVTIDDPGLFTGAVLRDRLSEVGICPLGVTRAATKPDYKNLNRLLEYHSQNLATTLKVTNAQSQNFYANALLKLLGARRFGRGSFDNGVAAVRDILSDRGLLDETVVIDDGCGLSHDNLISTTDLVLIMEDMHGSEYRDAYVRSLATPGDPEGTLEKRLKGERHNATIYAKTGYISRVKALSGYVLRNDGDVLIFAFIVNNYSSKSAWEVNNLQNKLMRSLSDCSMN